MLRILMKPQQRHKPNSLTRVSTHVDRLGPNTTVDFDVLLGEPGAELCHLRNAPLEEFLASTTYFEDVIIASVSFGKEEREGRGGEGERKSG